MSNISFSHILFTPASFSAHGNSKVRLSKGYCTLPDRQDPTMHDKSVAENMVVFKIAFKYMTEYISIFFFNYHSLTYRL